MAGLIAQTRTVVVRCDASPSIGYGHLVRCLALADALRSDHDIRVVFAMTEASAAPAVEARGYDVHLGHAELPPVANGEWLEHAILHEQAAALVLDVRDELPVDALRRWKGDGVLIATIDDPTERRLVADLAFYPPVPQVLSMDWSGFMGELHVGWEWIILRSDLLANRGDSPGREPPRASVLVTMGGSDPAGLTLRVLTVIDTLAEDFDTTVVVGPAHVNADALYAFLAVARRTYRVERDIQNMGELMARSQVAVAAFGSTAYELAVLGVPAITLSLTDDHAASAGALQKAGVGISLGVHAHVRDAEIAGAIRSLLSDEGRRRAMRRQAVAILDGLGAECVARTITQRLERASD